MWDTIVRRPPLARCVYNLSINSVTQAPTIALWGDKAGAGGWAQNRTGTLWSRRGTGTALSYGQAVSTRLRGVKFAGLGRADDNIDNFNAAFAVGLQDIAARIIFKLGASHSTAGYLISALNASSNLGWFLRITSAPAIMGALYNTAGTTITSATLVANSVYDAWLFIDRNENTTNGSQLYVNGATSGSGVNMSSRNADVSAIGQNSCIGSLLAGPYATSSTIAGLWVWLFPAGSFAGGATNLTDWGNCVSREYAKVLTLLS